MKFYFYPVDEVEFKNAAVGNVVRTLVFDKSSGKVTACFSRKVNKVWEQTCKNNIETDHRIKELKGDNFQIYSWVSSNESDFNLPSFGYKS